MEVLHERLQTLQNVLRRAEAHAVHREPAPDPMHPPEPAPGPAVEPAAADPVASLLSTNVAESETVDEPADNASINPTEGASDAALPSSLMETQFISALDEMNDRDNGGDTAGDDERHNRLAEDELGATLSSSQLSRAVEQIELVKRFIEIRREPSAAMRAELHEALRPLERRVLMNEVDRDFRFGMNRIREFSPDRLVPASDSRDTEEFLAEQELNDSMESAWRDCGSDMSRGSSASVDIADICNGLLENENDELHESMIDQRSNDALTEEQIRAVGDANVTVRPPQGSGDSLNVVSMLGDLIERELTDATIPVGEWADEEAMTDMSEANEIATEGPARDPITYVERSFDGDRPDENNQPIAHDPFPVGIRRRRAPRFRRPARENEVALAEPAVAADMNPLVLNRPENPAAGGAAGQADGNAAAANQPARARDPNDGLFPALTSWFFLVAAYVVVFQVTYEALPVLLGRAVLRVLSLREFMARFMADVARVSQLKNANFTSLVGEGIVLLGNVTNSSGSGSELAKVGVLSPDIAEADSSILSDLFSNSALEFQHGAWLFDQLDSLVTTGSAFDDESSVVMYMESIVGFFAFALIIQIALTIYFFCYVRSARAMGRYMYTQFAAVGRYVFATLKGTSLAYLELGLPPKLMGFLISVATIKVFQTTFEDRFDVCYELPILCGFVVWAVGVVLIFHFSIILISLHNLLREEVVDGLIPGVRDFDAMIDTVIGFYDNKTTLAHLKRIFITTSLYLFLFVSTIFVPLHFGHYLFPFMGMTPLKLRFAHKSSGTELERSVELLVSHMLIPFLIERSQGGVLDKLLRFILSAGGQIFKVGDLLSPGVFPFARAAPPQDTLDVLHVRAFEAVAPADGAAEPSTVEPLLIDDPLSPRTTPRATRWIDIEKFSVEFRVCAFVLFVLLCLSFAYSAALHVTLTTGRFLVSFIDAKAEHDANNFCVGVATCGGLVYAGSFIVRDIRSVELLHSIKTVFNKWGRIGAKLVVVGVCGLSVPPMLVGILNEAIVLNPLSVALDETPSFPLFRCWALGVIILKGWIK